MIKNCLLASTILAGVLALSIPASAVTVGGVAAFKLQPTVSDSMSDSKLLIQIRGTKSGSRAKGKGKGGDDVDDDDDDDDQGDDSDDQGEDDDDQGDDEQ